MTLEDWLGVADRAYFGAAIVALIATATTIVAGIAQSRAFNEFRISSETRAAELQKLAAEANQKAEEERTARLAMEAKFAWRVLSPEMRDKLKAALDHKVGLIRLAYIANDPCSRNLAVNAGPPTPEAQRS